MGQLFAHLNEDATDHQISLPWALTLDLHGLSIQSISEGLEGIVGGVLRFSCLAYQLPKLRVGNVTRVEAGLSRHGSLPWLTLSVYTLARDRQRPL
jgi:hypothetical protein